MNIDNQVNSIAENLISEITAKVQHQVSKVIETKINEAISSINVQQIMSDLLSKKLDARVGQLSIDNNTIQAQLQKRADVIIESMATTVQSTAIARVSESVNAQINRIDFSQNVQAVLNSAIRNQKLNFFAGSIPGEAINTENWQISGNNINSGIIKNFGSTGIEDKATGCQLTIFDDVTVIENNLLTKDLTVKGCINIEGDLNVTGTLPMSSPLYQNLVHSISDNVRVNLNQAAYDTYADSLLEQIKIKGLELNRLLINGNEIFSGSTLNNAILNSSLRTVGALQELQVTGESLLSETLYVTKGRIGVNTIEPSQTLSIWDQEIEFGFSKQTTNVAQMGLPRNHTLVISTNGKKNLTLTPDGATAVHRLSVGNISISSSPNPPSDNQPKGSIVFNENPSLGGPMGWVSLGESRWANFGIID